MVPQCIATSPYSARMKYTNEAHFHFVLLKHPTTQNQALIHEQNPDHDVSSKFHGAGITCKVYGVTLGKIAIIISPLDIVYKKNMLNKRNT